MGVLEAEDYAVITSGPYERFFTAEDGTVYHHILDPKTGLPVENGLASVSIISQSGVLADGLSTSCFVMGKKRAIEYWKASKEAFDMILVMENGTLLVTEGIAGQVSSDNPVTVIH